MTPETQSPGPSTHPGSSRTACPLPPGGGNPGAGAGGRGRLPPQSPHAPACSQCHPLPVPAPGASDPFPATTKPGPCPGHNRERVKAAVPRAEKDGVHPAPLNSGVETSPWSDWLADRFPGCPLRPQFRAGRAGRAAWVGGCAPVPGGACGSWASSALPAPGGRGPVPPDSLQPPQRGRWA